MRVCIGIPLFVSLCVAGSVCIRRQLRVASAVCLCKRECSVLRLRDTLEQRLPELELFLFAVSERHSERIRVFFKLALIVCV